ncbi:MAG: hypothetical protein EA381_20385 [Planctomycetaceae bacterium]|nr:MAG: hypothetical protein EA381_20385 [Planctomycetaceae bacterium]
MRSAGLGVSRYVIDHPEFQFGAHRADQTAVYRFDAKTGLDFGRLKEFDSMAATESRAGPPSLLLKDLQSILICASAIENDLQNG